MEIPFSNEEKVDETEKNNGDSKRRLIVGVVICFCIIFASVGYKIFDLGVLQAHSTVIHQTAQDESQQQVSEPHLEQSKIFVHVTGAVIMPGIYQFDLGARIDDAIKAAGGFTEEADVQALNLALGLKDEQQIVVPQVGVRQGEEYQEQNKPDTSIQNTVSSPSQQSGRININTATVKELTSLSGIGEATAKKIVDDREKNGKFQSTSDLQRVQGIGEKRYESLKDYICV